MQGVAGSNPAESTKLFGKEFYQETDSDSSDNSASGSGCDCGIGVGDSKPVAFESKQDFARLKCELEQALPSLSKNHLVIIRKMVTTQFVKRFKRSRIPKYGGLNKGFTEQELQAFFRVVNNPKFHLLFSYQAHLGLRLGEVIRVNLKQIKFESRELVVKTEKAMTLDTLLIPAPLFRETLEYIRMNQAEIEKAQGYIFFKEHGKSLNKSLYLDENYVRNAFRHYIAKTNLDEVYDQSDESRVGRSIRRLHRLTTHSLRHFAITHFAEQNNGNVFLASKFARHMKTDTTMTYLHVNKKALYEGIDGAFSISPAMNLKSKLMRHT